MFYIPPTGVERTVLATYPVAELPGYENRLVLLAFAPGAKTPVHNHPVPATGVVIKGKIISQWESGQVETYIEGEGFTDLGITPHIRGENASETEELLVVMSYVIKIGEPNINLLPC